MIGARTNRRSLALAALLLAAPIVIAATELTDDASRSLRAGGFLWEAANVAGPTRIVIDRAQQRAYVYRGEVLVGMSTVSTGKKGHRTPLGLFPILEKRAKHRSNKYSNAPMPFMQRLTWDGIALHAGQLPGYPASHGCIRLPWAFAQKLFALTALGATVEITDSGPQLPRVQMAAARKMPSAAPTADAALAVVTEQPPTLAVEPVTLVAAAPWASAPPRVVAPVPMRPRPIQFAEASIPPRAIAPDRPPRASWREQSADDYVTWGSVLPGAGASAHSR